MMENPVRNGLVSGKIGLSEDVFTISRGMRNEADAEHRV
jgi:hypothetical protein